MSHAFRRAVERDISEREILDANAASTRLSVVATLHPVILGMLEYAYRAVPACSISSIDIQ